ncbi:MAG: TolB family protein, partial [Planctomycetota bacterium]
MKLNLSGEKSFNFSLSFFVLAIALTIARAEYIAPGVKLTRLTDDGRSVAAAWAYKGNQVAYFFSETATQNQLMVMNSDGTNKQAITEVGNPYFVEWSWDSTKLSYEFSNSADSQSQAQVYIYDFNLKKTYAVSAPYTLSALDQDDGPFWSANDRYVAYLVRF